MNACSFGFHRWTNWVYRVVEGTDYEFTQERQERTCERCGKRQMEVIR